MNLFSLFEKQIPQNKLLIAIKHNEKEYSYKFFIEHVNRASLEFKRAGIGSFDVVLLRMPLSFHLIVSMFALWKLGAVVLPIDIYIPLDRIELYLKIAKTRAEVTLEEGIISTQIIHQKSVGYKSDNLAYIMFTSGSTGIPKGVKITHKNVISLIKSWKIFYGLADFTPKVLQLSSISTDMFIGNVIKSLFFEGTLILVDKKEKMNFAELVKLIKKNTPNIVETTPSYMRLMLEYCLNEPYFEPDSIKQIIVGGEACAIAEYKWFTSNFSNTRVINGYGLTECTIESFVFEGQLASENRKMSIGNPLKNTFYYIVDEELKLVLDGEKGELLIYGEAISSGYLDESMNEERFISFQGQRCYRTGDIVRKIKSGQLLFCGRKDEQVQINGYRVELKEIENTICLLKGINEAIVLNVSKDFLKPKIVAFVVSEIDKDEIFNKIRRRLIEQMIPSEIRILSEFPKTISGKIDRQKLLENFYQESSYVSLNEDEQSKLLYEIVLCIEAVLGKKVEANKSIMEQGADSLAVLKIIHQLHLKGIEVKIAEIYSSKNIFSLVANIVNSSRESGFLNYSFSNKIIDASLVRELIGVLRAKEVEYYNNFIQSGISDRVSLSVWKEKFRFIHRKVYNLEYIVFENTNEQDLQERFSKAILEQELLRSALVDDDLAYFFVTYNMPTKLSPILIDLDKYNLEESQIFSLFPVIKEYLMLDDKIRSFPFRHFFVKFSSHKIVLVFCMDEAIHNKIGDDIFKNYLLGLSVENVAPYSEYLDFLKEGSSLNQQEIIKEFQIEKITHAMKQFPTFSYDELSLFEHFFPIHDSLDELDMALDIFWKITTKLFDVDIPFVMIQDTRVYKDNRFVKTIGEFTDFIPSLISKNREEKDFLKDCHDIRKKAVLTRTNFRVMKWDRDGHNNSKLREFFNNVYSDGITAEKFVVFHYLSGEDSGIEFTYFGRGSWPVATSFNFFLVGNKLKLLAYLPCNQQTWSQIVESL